MAENSRRLQVIQKEGAGGGHWIKKIHGRKLVQWALGYVAIAWLFLEISTFVADRFGWQETLTRGVRILLGVGFFLTLVLALVSRGERGTTAQRR